MSGWWEKQINRADELAPNANGSKELLTFYAQLLRAQRSIYDQLRGRKDWLPSGHLEKDMPILTPMFPGFLSTIKAHGPASLAAKAHELSEADSDVVKERLRSYWMTRG